MLSAFPTHKAQTLQSHEVLFIVDGELKMSNSHPVRSLIACFSDCMRLYETVDMLLTS